ncbi:drug/metabolite transporter (DMT)-like permease [Bradyrhizobium sp. S3.14.4]
MFTIASLWIPFTVIAALGQVARNAMQRSLTKPLGTWGATNIRFLFGFPFSLLFLGVVLIATGDHLGMPPTVFWPWLLLGALSQIVATGLMLLAMNDRSFVVTTAYLKTEAIQTAIFGFVFLGDHLTWLKVLAIVIATVGVVITALRPGGEKSFAELKPTITGLVAAAAFALSAVGFRGAIINVPDVSFVTAASFTLVLGLFVQTLVLTIYLLWRAPKVLQSILGLWKPSLLAGFIGRVRLAILVPGLRADGRRQCPHARFDRGAVRARRGVLLVQSADRAARDFWYRVDRRWRCGAGGGLVPIFRQRRQRRHLDAFVDQRLCLVGRSLAIDRTVLLVAVMHRAGFVRKTLADIVGVLDDVIAQLLELGAQLALLRHHQRGRSRRRGLGRRR